MTGRWRILVADDEPVILEGICRFIEQSSIDYEIVAQAGHGEEAIRSMLELKPDIVVSDVQMPKATGLDLIRIARENALKIQFIFISGYQEFEYVKEAMRYNAVDYLLKPISMEELQGTLEKAVRKMSEQAVIKILHEEKNPIQIFFEKIYHGREFTENESYERFRELKLDIRQDDFFQGISFQVKPGSMENTGFGQTELIRFVLYDKVQQYLEREKTGFLAAKDDAGGQFIMYAQDEDKLMRLCSEIVAWRLKLEEEYQLKLRIGVGGEVKGARELVHAYKTAYFAQELHYFEDTRDVIYYNHVHKRFDNSFEDYERAVNELKEALIFHQESYKTYMEKVFDIVFNLHYGNRKAAENRIQLLVEEITAYLFSYNMITEEEQKKKDECCRRLGIAETYQKVREECSVYIERCFNRSLEIASNKESAEIIRVKAYIKAHYADEISLNVLADLAGMTSSYLSSLFKRSTGKNYMEYLIDVRMEEAHRLLLGTDLMTYEISEAVGYRTVRRFVETFKKKFGMSPVEYKKAHM